MPEDSNLFFTAQGGDDVTANAAGELFTASIPLGVVRNIAVGSHKLYLQAIVMQALVGAGDSVDIDLLTATNQGITAGVVTVQQAIVSFPAASPVGTRLYAEVPESTYNSATFLQENLYLGAQSYARGSGAPSQGLIFCELTLEPGVPHIYPTTTLV